METTIYKMHTVRSLEYLPDGGTWYWSLRNDERNDGTYQVDMMEELAVVLPEGYKTGQNTLGDLCVFGPSGRAVDLCGSKDAPALAIGPGRYIGLRQGCAAQIVTPKFREWLYSTSFSGIVDVGDQWDTEVAWPDPETMSAARECYRMFAAGNLREAESLMQDAQEPFV